MFQSQTPAETKLNQSLPFPSAAKGYSPGGYFLKPSDKPLTRTKPASRLQQDYKEEGTDQSKDSKQAPGCKQLKNFKHGKGVQKLYDPELGNIVEKYEGNFYENMRSGQGILTVFGCNQDTEYHGTFRNGTKNGKFIVFTKSKQGVILQERERNYHNDIEVDYQIPETQNKNSMFSMDVFGNYISEKSLKDLTGNKMISPSIISAFASRLYHEYKADLGGNPSTMLMNQFWSDLVGSGASLKSHPLLNLPAVDHYSMDKPIFLMYRNLIIPIQLQNIHFSLLYVQFKLDDSFGRDSFTVTYYDSLKLDVIEWIQNIITQYLKHEYSKLKGTIDQKTKMKISSCISRLKVMTAESGLQHNDIDCGIWVCYYIKSIFRKIVSPSQPMPKFQLTLTEINGFRQTIRQVVLNEDCMPKKLLSAKNSE